MKNLFRGAFTAAILLTACPYTVRADSASQPSADRGRYLVHIAGCNDCHTAGYASSGGTVPETEWLKGDSLGWRGPWGTTYAANLRLLLSQMTEEQWVFFAHNLHSRPPMPSFNLNVMTEEDLRSIYRFVHQLRPVGEPAPAYLPPNAEPETPYVLFPSPPAGN